MLQQVEFDVVRRCLHFRIEHAQSPEALKVIASAVERVKQARRNVIHSLTYRQSILQGFVRPQPVAVVGRFRPEADNGNEDPFKSSIVVIKFFLLGALKRLALWRQDKNEKPTNKRKPAL